jgi:DNA-binding protein HU-beta
MPAKKTTKKTAAKKTAAKAAPAKKAAVKKAAKPAAEKAPKKAPISIEAVAKAAYLNYRRRVEEGLPGCHDSDWLEAERSLAD